MQDKITQRIVAALALKLTAGEQEYVVRKETNNIGAYDAFLKGWEHYRRFTPDDFAKAYSYFEKALDLDPDYGRAHAALAQTYWRGLELGWRWQMGLGVGWSEGRILARKYLQTAVKYPTSLAHQVASAMNLFRREYDEAIYEANRAITLDPNDHEAHWIMAWVLIYAGRSEDAVEFTKTAMRLDPHYAAPNLFLLGLAHFSMGKLEEAVTLFERAHSHNPDLRGKMGKVTRRQFLKGAVAGGTAMAASITAPGVLQKAYAQKVRLNILFVYHWVPGAADIHKEIINEWAKKNNVEINIDFVAQVRDIRSVQIPDQSI